MTTIRTTHDVPSPLLPLIAAMVLGVFVMVLSAASVHSHKQRAADNLAHNDCQLCHVIQQKIVPADEPHVYAVHFRVVAPATTLRHATLVASAPQRTNGPPRAPPIELV